MNMESMRQLSKWMGFVGIMTIIGGVIAALSGVFAFIVGAIPGIVAVIMGLKLRSAKESADAMILQAGEEQFSGNFNLFVANLNTYFKIQGVLIIVSLVFGLLMGIMAFVLSFAFVGSVGSYF